VTKLDAGGLLDQLVVKELPGPLGDAQELAVLESALEKVTVDCTFG
jgi:hypothetical protein